MGRYLGCRFLCTSVHVLDQFCFETYCSRVSSNNLSLGAAPVIDRSVQFIYGSIPIRQLDEAAHVFQFCQNRKRFSGLAAKGRQRMILAVRYTVPDQCPNAGNEYMNIVNRPRSS